MLVEFSSVMLSGNEGPLINGVLIGFKEEKEELSLRQAHVSPKRKIFEKSSDVSLTNHLNYGVSLNLVSLEHEFHVFNETPPQRPKIHCTTVLQFF